jgi:hypothetical protein
MFNIKHSCKVKINLGNSLIKVKPSLIKEFSWGEMKA